MKQAIVFILLCSISPALAVGPGVTVKVEPVVSGEDTRLAVPGQPPAVVAPASELRLLPSDSGWTLIDSMVMHAMIPAGQRMAVVFDSATESLRDTLLPEFLNDSAKMAVAIAPDWLQDDLADKFRRLGAAQQSRYAEVILNCPDKRYYDEICFQVAHLAPGTLSSMNAQILADNVQQAYQVDPELQYVDIVDYGDAMQGGDYYSTTKYRVRVQSETTWVEIPRDIYYWWVIMPKGTDELPQYVMDYFWREYLFYCNDSGYPLLREKLAPTQLFWDGRKHAWGGGFEDTMQAVAVVGRWAALTMPRGAEGNRPIQPVTIAHEHNGNCGEMQDLLQAAARTALIPCGGVNDINEDHVWNEVWWDNLFIPYANDPTTHIADSGCAYEKKYGGSKDCSAIWDWRNDGWQRSVIGTYSDVCTLTVQVYDSCLRPVDGEIVKLSSEAWGGGMINCFFGVTDRSGRYTTVLGDNQNYYLTLSGPLGDVAAGKIIDSAAATPGSSFFYACTLSGRLESLAITSDSGTPLDRFRIDVSYSAAREVVYGYDCFNSGGYNEYALVDTPGAADFFIASQPEFLGYLSDQPFRAFVNDENLTAANHSLVLSEPGNHYAVFSNEEQGNLMVLVDATVRLYGWDLGVAETPGGVLPERWATIGSSPFRGRLAMRLAANRPADAVVALLDRSGRVVQRLAAPGAGQCRVFWDGTDQSGRSLSPGVYFCRFTGGGRSLTRSVVYLGVR
ncbi:hypothetical protein FJY68_11250 [candidate division WOR-3 bacterium]|uniref:FlgD Ig-like domain-containing protein n=1 Tax=candidate division WOR-3 bacterium TaxID=2052148 RepID=A0A937XFD6_UNCW3|nr:hypothetical protein [candidate division WOR-3 bacterium]